MKRVCAYTRISTDSTDQQNSLENQKKYFEMKAKAEGVELVEIYADEGITATHNNRPNFIKMLQDAGLYVAPKISVFTKRPLKNKFDFEINPNVKPKFAEIWIKNTSRFARNTLSQEIIDLLITKGVHIFFVEQNIHTKDELSRGLLLKLFQVFDEQDSKDKSLKIMQGRKSAAMSGKLISNGLLYGYDYDNGELKKNEEEAKVIEEIFDLYSQGLGFRRIENILKIKDYKTRNGKHFSMSTLKRILENEKYAGILATNKWDSGVVFRKHYPKHKDPSEWHVFEDKIEPIISKELFYKCQDFRNKKINTVNQKGVYHGISEYSGLIKCANCGENYYSNVDKGRQFYNCKTKKHLGKNACDNHNISKKKIDDLITELANGDFYKDVITDIKVEIYKLQTIQYYLIGKLDVDNTEQVKKLNLKLEKLNSKYNNYMDLYAEEGLKRKDYIKLKLGELSNEMEQIDKKIEESKKDNLSIINDIDEIKSVIERLRNIKIKEKYTEEEILEQLENITIGKSPEDGSVMIMLEYKILSFVNNIMGKYDLDEYCFLEFSDEEIKDKLEKLERVRSQI